MKGRVLALLALAACSAAPDLPPAPIGLRNPTAPVASQADVSLARLAGDWVIVEGAGVPVGAPVRIGSQSLAIAEDVLPLSMAAPGRLRVGDAPVWVHWLDFDNRTAAMGDPNGTRVWIMDRAGAPAERLAAAREILEWYGYDLTRMQAAGRK